MKIHNIILFLAFFIFVQSVFGQKNQDKIIWGEKLQWRDFRGQPNYNTPHLASANTGLSASFSWETHNGKPKLVYQVYAIFNPQRSWVKPGRQTLDLLKHEQLHFDISEITARKFRKYLENQNIHPKRLSKKVDRKGEKLRKENKRLQQKYDRQTRHGTHDKRQAQWEQKIKQQLQNLENYLTIPRKQQVD